MYSYTGMTSTVGWGRSARLRSCLSRVIVKSAVFSGQIDSSGGLIDLCRFDTIVEFHSDDYLAQIIESS